MRAKAVWIVGLLSLFGGGAHAQYDFPRVLSPDNLTQVSAHVWVIRGFPNIGIVVGERGTLVVDTGMGPKNGEIASRAALGLSHNGQKLYLTTTHFHPEHAGGDGGFPTGTTVIRPRVQQQELEADGLTTIEGFSNRSEVDRALLAGVKIKPADVVFDNSYAMDLGGGVQVKLLWFGPAHTRGDELVMEPDSDLISGDVVQNKTGPGFSCAECNPRRWLAVLDGVKALHPRIVVPDHSPVGDNSLIAQERAMLTDLQSSALALKAKGTAMGDAEQIVTKQFSEKYPGWIRMNGIANAVGRVYADSGAR